MYAFLLAAAVSGSAAAQSYQPDFDPGRLKGPAKGPANEVMVLGTSHFHFLGKAFAPAALRPIEDRLAAWKPDLTAIESLSGAQCDHLRRYPARYADTIPSYCWDPAPARATTGLDVPAATVRAEELLANWPASPTPGQRRQLAAVFLAGGERTSALVQWLRLPQAERRAGDGLDAALVAFLEELRTKRDERMLLAAPLAARLGHEQVYPMDDHTADRVITDRKAWADAVMTAWKNPATEKRTQIDMALEGGLGTPEGVLARFRADNAPGQTKLAFDSDFGAALEEPSAKRLGRGYVGYWETRNLRMASNIRDAMGPRPGMRILVIVGAAHKGYLEAYLHQMHDVRVVDSRPLLH